MPEDNKEKDKETKKEYRHFNTTIMFIDMKGWTSRTSKSSRSELKKTLDEFENIVFPIVKKHGGKIIKGLGDAFLISFHSPTDSVLCGLEIQKQIKERNKEVSKKEGFTARVGLSSGEVYERGGDIFGEPVNLASRIQNIAKGGEVAFGESVYHAMNKNEISFTSLGKHKLKGIDHKVQIYQAHEKRNISILTRIKTFFRRHKRKILIGLIILFLLILITNRGNKPITEYDWRAESIASLQEDNQRAMKELVNSYEKTPADKVEFEDKILAASMYHRLGNNERAFEILKSALGEAKGNQELINRIYEAAKELDIDLAKPIERIRV